MNKSQKIRDLFTKKPDSKPADVAKKFNAPVSMVYRLRKEVLSGSPGEPAAMEHDTLTTDQGVGQVTWTAAQTDEGDIVATLTERGTRYGKFSGHAQVTQEIKRAMTRHAHAINNTFTDSQWEALEMIAHKIGRIINGDPNYADSWVDIAGYAKLVADELQGVKR
jgi:hypothetical protein